METGDNKLVYWILGFFSTVVLLILSAVITSVGASRTALELRIGALEVQIGSNRTISVEMERRLLRVEDKIDDLNKVVDGKTK